MKQDCVTYRALLRERFDAGAPLEVEGPEHAEACADCAAFRERLLGFAGAFGAMPLEVPRNALTQRVKSRLAAEPAYSNDTRWWLPAAALCACALLVCTVLYYSVPLDPAVWWDFANESSVTPAWLSGEFSLANDLAMMQVYWNDVSTVFALSSSPLLWAVATAAVILLAGLNGAEAYRLRIGPDAPAQNRPWRS